jgi:hypothetical protein
VSARRQERADSAELDTVSLTLMSTVWWACAVVGGTSIEITCKTALTRYEVSRRAEVVRHRSFGTVASSAQRIACGLRTV